MKILQLFLILILFLFPFGELLRFSLGNNIVLKPLDIAVGLTSVVYVILLIRKKVSVDRHYFTLILVFLTIGLIALFCNSSWLQPKELFASSLYLLRWLGYGIVFLAALSSPVWFKAKLKKLLLIDGIIIVALGFLQYFFFSSLKPLFAFGWDDHMYRLFSVFLDPNFTGAFFVLFFCFVAGLWFQEKKQWYLILLVLIVLASFLTFSRAAIIMFIVSSAVFCLLMQKKKLFLFITGSLCLFFVAASPFFFVENVNLFRQASSVARLDNYTTAIVVILDKPFLGVGFNSYRYAKNHYGIQSNWVPSPSHADAGVDNSFLFVMATTGVIGLAMYLLFWWEVGQKAWRLSRRKSSIQARVVLSSIAGLFINALFINSLFFPACLLWLYFQISLLEE